MITISRRMLGTLLVAVLVLIPATASALQFFGDVPPSDWAYEDIQWLAAEGLTNGCQANPPLYCPDEPVTRREMAAFMHRLATERAVDAGTLNGYGISDFVFNTEWVEETTNFSYIPDGGSFTATVTCPLNKYVVSGGGSSNITSMVISSSSPNEANTKWMVVWRNVSGGQTPVSGVTVHALCAGAGSRRAP